MNKERIIIDNNGKEIISYKDPLFLLEIWHGIDDSKSLLNLPVHWHSEFEFAIVLNGTLKYHFQGQSYKLRKGDCIFVNSDCLHSVESYSKDENEMFTIAFPASFLFNKTNTHLEEEYLNPILSSGINGMIINKDLPYGNTIHQLLYRVYNCKSNDFGYELQATSLLNELWLNLIMYVKTNHDLINTKDYKYSIKERDVTKKALSYIYEHYNDKILIEDIANAANISRTSCFRIFKADFEKTPLEILNDYRLTIATRLLSGEKSITEIALSCGFNSLSYFSKQFNQKYGMSPYTYRKNVTNNIL